MLIRQAVPDQGVVVGREVIPDGAEAEERQTREQDPPREAGLVRLPARGAGEAPQPHREKDKVRDDVGKVRDAEERPLVGEVVVSAALRDGIEPQQHREGSDQHESECSAP